MCGWLQVCVLYMFVCSTYVCMHVCMYMYVCMHVCSFGINMSDDQDDLVYVSGRGELAMVKCLMNAGANVNLLLHVLINLLVSVIVGNGIGR